MRFFVNTDARWFAFGRYDLRDSGYGLVYYLNILGWCLNLNVGCRGKAAVAELEL